MFGKVCVIIDKVSYASYWGYYDLFSNSWQYSKVLDPCLFLKRKYDKEIVILIAILCVLFFVNFYMWICSGIFLGPNLSCHMEWLSIILLFLDPY